jgi:rubrerythrin
MTDETNEMHEPTIPRHLVEANARPSSPRLAQTFEAEAISCPDCGHKSATTPSPLDCPSCGSHRLHYMFNVGGTPCREEGK